MNHPPQPFTEEWFRLHPGQGQCPENIISASIENYLFMFLVVAGIIVYLFLKRKSRNKIKVIFSVTDNFSPKMRMTMEEMKKLNYHFNSIKKSRFEKFYDSISNFLSKGKSFAPNELKSFK